MIKWKYDPNFCSYEANTSVGKYACVRTAFDVSKLYLNFELLGSWSTGSHNEAMKFAEEHFRNSQND